MIFPLIIMCDCHCLSTVMIKYSFISFFAKYMDSVAVSDRKLLLHFLGGCISITGGRRTLGPTVSRMV